MDMTDIPREFPQIDLLWSEGAAYNIGFANALRIWSHAIRPGGFVVVSELAWLRDRVADAEREFFSAAYPDMRQARQNLSLAESAGYDVLDTHTLPREAWIEGYYDVLETRANALADHPDDCGSAHSPAGGWRRSRFSGRATGASATSSMCSSARLSTADQSNEKAPARAGAFAFGVVPVPYWLRFPNRASRNWNMLMKSR